MTPTQYVTAIRALGWSIRNASKPDRLNINERTSRSYASGRLSVPKRIEERLMAEIEWQFYSEEIEKGGPTCR